MQLLKVAFRILHTNESTLTDFKLKGFKTISKKKKQKQSKQRIQLLLNDTCVDKSIKSDHVFLLITPNSGRENFNVIQKFVIERISLHERSRFHFLSFHELFLSPARLHILSYANGYTRLSKKRFLPILQQLRARSSGSR